MKDFKLWVITFLIITKMVVTESQIPTTLDGPFKPVTHRLDPSLRKGSSDLPMDDPRIKRNVTSNFPEQIALAISSPTSVWVSWVTGKSQKFSIFYYFSCCALVILVNWVCLYCLGDAQVGSNFTELDPSSVLSEVWYGKESGKYTSVAKGVSTVYSQLYPFKGLLNYTSGIIHHVRLKGTSSLFITLN